MKNNQKIKVRNIHINEFPADRIFVYLDNEFHKKLFDEIREFKFNEFNDKFFEGKLKYPTFKQWKRKKTNVKNHFIPLWFILELSKNFPQFTIEEIEKNIVAFKGPSSASIITNPNLPLIEDERLMRILAHLIGDGSVGGGFGSRLPKGKQHSEYRNFAPELLDSFEYDLGVFGYVPTTKNYQHGSVVIPNVIGYILKHLYKIEFDTFNSRIPEKLFNLSRDLTANFIRAFGDDEAHVFDSSIEFYSANSLLIGDILRLINIKFTEINASQIKINKKAGKNIKYSFSIYNNSLKNYFELINFDHEQKREDLAFNINRINNFNPSKAPKIGMNKEKVLKLLEEEQLTAKQISRRLGIRHSTVLDHINRLKNEGKIRVFKIEKGANVWESF